MSLVLSWAYRPNSLCLSLMAVTCSCTTSGMGAPMVLSAFFAYVLLHWNSYFWKKSNGSGVFFSMGAKFKPRRSTLVSVEVVRFFLLKLRMAGILLVNGLWGAPVGTPLGGSLPVFP